MKFIYEKGFWSGPVSLWRLFIIKLLISTGKSFPGRLPEILLKHVENIGCLRQNDIGTGLKKIVCGKITGKYSGG